MDPAFYIVILIVFFLLSILITYLIFKNRNCFTKNQKILYYRMSDSLTYNEPSITALQPFVELSNAYFKQTNKYVEADMIMFETLNSIDRLMQDAKFTCKVQFIYGLRGTDMIASKSMLALTLSKNICNHLLPRTYIVEGGLDKERFSDDFNRNPSSIYILKKNIQRQEGFIITRSKSILLDAFNDSDFVVCQELLQDPLVIGGRKTNIRVYMLVVVRPDSTTSIYMYNDGFMYYTAEMWEPNSIDSGPNITTGYIDRQVYVENPLTTQDMIKYLGPRGPILRENMILTMGQLASVYAPMFKESNKSYPGHKFLIYGCDVAPSSSLDILVMEVNKGPDLSYKDERDKTLKLGMVEDMLQLLGILPFSKDKKSGFIQLI